MRPQPATEAALQGVERQLAALGAALRDGDALAIEHQASALQRALAAAIHRFGEAAGQAGGMPPALRQRLALAGGEVAAQRECLARASAALGRAIDVLMPAQQVPTVYDTGGHSERSASSGSLHA